MTLQDRHRCAPARSHHPLMVCIAVMWWIISDNARIVVFALLSAEIVLEVRSTACTHTAGGKAVEAVNRVFKAILTERNGQRVPTTLECSLDMAAMGLPLQVRRHAAWRALSAFLICGAFVAIALCSKQDCSDALWSMFVVCCDACLLPLELLAPSATGRVSLYIDVECIR